MPRAAITIIVALLLCAPCASGTSWIVDASGGGDFLTIKEAVIAAAPGDDIGVRPGTYTGLLNRDIDFGGKDLNLFSSGGPDVTIIDCQTLGRAFHFHSGESLDSVIEGFTITNGYADDGGGIFCTELSSCTIRDCVITYCATSYDGFVGGGGVCCNWESATQMYGCTLRGNSTMLFGGGALFMSSATPVIQDCVFEDNHAGISAGGLYVFYDSFAQIYNTMFAGNTSDHHGGGLLISQAGADIQDCTFYANSAAQLGGGIHCYESHPEIFQTIVAFSTDGEGITCGGLAFMSNPSIWNCDLFGNADGDSLCGDYYDNLYEDPLFCDASAGDLSLCSDSPCLSDNNGWSVTMGGIGEGCGACGTGLPEDATSWTTIKAVFR
ncbi:MAG: right-handed parallel beta-helix repeat-containing protein [Candidatus Eisenbacteria bacterium]|nr:right-handed parallel beta-helix repeat-containing protein [Candidatus Eisenbacteria bacterium]